VSRASLLNMSGSELFQAKGRDLVGEIPWDAITCSTEAGKSRDPRVGRRGCCGVGARVILGLDVDSGVILVLYLAGVTLLFSLR
jgi:hypothetical protein